MIRFVSAAVMALLLGCGTTVPTLETGPNAEITHDGLHRVDRSRRFDRAWVKPGASLEGYTKVMLVGAGIHYKRPPKRVHHEYALSEKQLTHMREGLRDAFADALEENGGWQIVTERGPDVLVLRGALIDLVVTAPTDGFGRDRSYSSSVGQATLVIELFDSESLEILLRIADRGLAENESSWRNDEITNRAAARRLFRKWAYRFRSALDAARTVGLPGEARTDEASSS